jgi:hypothetical protein
MNFFLKQAAMVAPKGLCHSCLPFFKCCLYLMELTAYG